MKKSYWQIVFASLALVVILISVALLAPTVPSQPNPAATPAEKTNDPIRHTQAELEERYHDILTHVTPNHVHPRLRPIHFNIGTKFAASGTLVLNTDGTPWQIVTANHLFSETQPGSDYYDYNVLSPRGYIEKGHVSGVTLDSLRHGDTPEGIEDVALCQIGEPALISRTSKVRVSAAVPITGAWTPSKISPVRVTSVTTGEKFDVVGQVLNDKRVPCFIMLYESRNGESGSGFWGDDGNLYILSGSGRLNDENRKTLGVPDSYRYITWLSRVSINF